MVDEGSRPGRITMDMQELKAPWLAWCKQQGVTPSEAMRQVAAKLTRSTPPEPQSGFDLSDGGEDGDGLTVRKKITLRRDEAEALNALAASEGFSLPRWIVALLRARMGRGHQFGQVELERLAESNLRLLSIGRNLNQIAKALNAQGADRKLYRLDLVEALHAQIREHTKIVADAMSANIERWKGK